MPVLPTPRLPPPTRPTGVLYFKTEEFRERIKTFPGALEEPKIAAAFLKMSLVLKQDSSYFHNEHPLRSGKAFEMGLTSEQFLAELRNADELLFPPPSSNQRYNK